MREIKFKIWDNVDKRMLHTHDDIRSYAKEKGEMWQEIMIPGMFTNLEFLQFTGLKDQNGVDIYEGDITKCGYDFKICETKWTGSGFSLGHKYSSNIEIIGNIYQNHELLTK